MLSPTELMERAWRRTQREFLLQQSLRRRCSADELGLRL